MTPQCPRPDSTIIPAASASTSAASISFFGCLSRNSRRAVGKNQRMCSAPIACAWLLRDRRDAPVRAAAAERALDELALVRTRRVVGVDLSGLDVAVAHPLLQRAHRYARGRHPGAERVAQIVEADRPERRTARGRLEPPEQPSAVEWRPDVRVAETRCVVRAVEGSLVV